MRKTPLSRFIRRKSSGNLLDDVENIEPANPSFRVLERRDVENKSFGGGDKLRSATADGRPQSMLLPRDWRGSREDMVLSNRFDWQPALTCITDVGRTSEQTFGSTSSQAQVSNHTRSAYSTGPSSLASVSQDDLLQHYTSSYDPLASTASTPDRERPRPRSSIFNARAFSFPKPTRSTSPPRLADGTYEPIIRRERAVTELSEASTAKATRPESTQRIPSTPLREADGNALKRSITRPNEEMHWSLPGRKSKQTSPSPNVKTSAAKEPPHEPLFSPIRSPIEYPPRLRTRSRSPDKASFDSGSDFPVDVAVDAINASTALEKLHGTKSPHLLLSSRQFPAKATYNPGNRSPISPFSNKIASSSSSAAPHAITAIANRPQGHNIEHTSAEAQADHSTTTTDMPDRLRMSVSPGRVLSRAAYDHIRTTSVDNLHDPDDTETVPYDEDDDPDDHSMKESRRRQEQEAKMAAFRDRMRKQTGEDVLNSSRGKRLPTQDSRHTLDPAAIPSVPSPSNAEGYFDRPEDEDDIPLSTLTAWKRTSQQGIFPQAASASSAIPPFARKLPQDPYLGANLVNQPLLETLPYSNRNFATSTSSLQIPPGGLIGVIAEEERARAARRANSGFYGQRSASQAAANTSNVPYTLVPPSMPAYAPLQSTGKPSAHVYAASMQAQVDMMQQQLAAMQLQAQAQYQQTSWQQYINPPQHVLPPSRPQSMFGVPSIFPSSGMTRPLNYAPSVANMSAALPPQQFAPSNRHSFYGPPNFSTYAPSIAPSAQLAPRSTIRPYAASLAASERSNVGQPSRYRSDGRPQVYSTQSSYSGKGKLSASRSSSGETHAYAVQTPRAADHRVSSRQKRRSGGPAVSDDDEDAEEAGWKAMAQEMEKRKREYRNSRPMDATAAAAKSGI
ncbi:hypothetical protein MRB53_042108 [Persea americana]|nr:hypothetical protein MRB53_042108 [Persea americana]